MKNNYSDLLDIYKEIYLLESLSGVLYWDLNTKKIPVSGLDYRTQQFNWISKQIHRRITNERIGALLSFCENNETLNQYQKRNVLLLRRKYDDNTAIPEELIGKLAIQSNKTLEVWKKAKTGNQFQIVQSDLEKLFTLNIQKAELLAKKKEINDPYEALISNHDPGFKVDYLTDIFTRAKKFLTSFMKKCYDSSIQPDLSFLSRKVSREIQVKLIKDLARFLGYTDKISEVEHPLTIGCGPRDARVTVKFHENQPMKAFFSCAHECGHALHSLQRNPNSEIEPIKTTSYPSFGESQSRFIENIICGSKEFWSYYYSCFQEKTGGIFNDINEEDFYLAINNVQPSFIRMSADEVTYALHIIVRFEIERDLFGGKIEIKDLPQIWNEKYEDYLGVIVPTDTLGLMQDLHWYSQYWGYFFGYALGDIMNAQLTTALTMEIPRWKDSLSEGKFSTINDWLAKNIYAKGALYDSLDMIKEITHKPLSIEFFKKYLETKYSDLYQF